MHTSTLTFRAPRSFHPPASLLGRGLRRWIGNPLRAEATYWIVLVLTVAVAVMGTQWGWLWLRDMTTPETFLDAAVWYAGAQAAALVVFVLVAYVGWRPTVAVRLTDETLRIQQGPAALELPRSVLRTVRPIDATEEHRTLRRRVDVRRFVAKAYDPLLVMDVEDEPLIVLALPVAERERFEEALGPATFDPRPATSA
ncbi:MAG: hypothetical protein AAGF99_02895 [Bacteroidota bacterium]